MKKSYVRRLIKRLVLKKETLYDADGLPSEAYASLDSYGRAYDELGTLCLPRFKQWLVDNGLLVVKDGLRASREDYSDLYIRVVPHSERATRFETEVSLSPWLHVLNKRIDFSKRGWLKDFLSIEGEVCFSMVKDQHHSLRGALVGVVMTGIPSHTFLRDAWSSVCPVTGLRYQGEDVGTLRYEAWMSPRMAEFITLMTDNEEMFLHLKMLGYTVELLPHRRNRPKPSVGGWAAQLIEKWDE